ncbi:MAG TPA: hypothetical protein VKY37_04425 [Brumimicrobium sp.]|nr:hypothetical protein [Brumimicrobium sp.]
MRIFMFILVSVFILSCKEQVDSSRYQSVEENLSDGEWRIVSTDKSFNRFQKGLKFSPDRQVFNIDSQGRAIFSSHERIYSVTDDTLKIVDYKYEDQFLNTKGTDILIIKELTNKKMVLEALYPQGPVQLVLEKIK